MQLYSDQDIDLFTHKIDQIEENLEEKEKMLTKDILNEKKNVEHEILAYIKEYKRKVYGGYAQNKLISIKNKNDAFYKEDAIADLDFYSDDPIIDLIRLTNMLYQKGYKYVQASEATHKETYSIFVNFEVVCDISYVPKNIYHRIPFVDINGINYVHPSFIMIDLYRIFTDPVGSGTFRWKKTFPRLYLLQKHYPFNKATSKLPINFEQVNTNHKKLLDTVYNYIINKDSIIVSGKYAYNYFLEHSNIMKDNSLGKKYTLLDIDNYTLISTNYSQDASDIYKILKNNYPQFADQINVVEYYPFWQFFGYSATISFNNIPIVTIYHYNKRCLPIKIVPSMKFQKNGSMKTIVDKDNKINLASYSLNLLMNMIMTFRTRVEKQEDLYQFHNIMTSHLIEIRNYYLNKNKKTLFDNTIFQEFVIDCIGKSIDIIRETRLQRYIKAKEKQGPVVFRYDPADGIKEPKSTYKFANTSGNPIRNPSNFRVIEVDKSQLKPENRDRTRGIEDEPQIKELEEDEQEELI